MAPSGPQIPVALLYLELWTNEIGSMATHYSYRLTAFGVKFSKKGRKIKNHENKTLLFDIFKKQAAIFTFGLAEPINT
jgi:hypothetical protein